MNNEEKRYKVEKIQKLDKEINNDKKLQIMYIIAAVIYAASSILWLSYSIDADFKSSIKSLFLFSRYQ